MLVPVHLLPGGMTQETPPTPTHFLHCTLVCDHGGQGSPPQGCQDAAGSEPSSWASTEPVALLPSVSKVVTKQVDCSNPLVPKGPFGARCCKTASCTLPTRTPAPTLPIPIPRAENFLSPPLTLGDRYAPISPPVIPILHRGRPRNKEMKPFTGHASGQWQIIRVTLAGPVLNLRRALRRAAGPSPLLHFPSRKPSSSPWLPCSLASPGRVAGPAEDSVRHKTVKRQ